MTCPACEKADRLRVWARFEDAEIVGCARCGFGRTVPESAVSAASYDVDASLAEGYQSQEKRYLGYAARRMRAVRRYVTRGVLLDVRCSVGYLVEGARRAGFEAVGVDMDRNAIAVGSAADRNIFAGTMQEALLGARSQADVIILQHVLEHLREPEGLLHEVRASLAPGGWLFLWQPNVAGLLPRLFPYQWYGWQQQQHYRHYTPRGLKTLLEACSFEVVSAKTESMDHAFRLQADLKTTLIAAMQWGIARVGLWTGQGDEIALVARKPENRS